MIYLSKKALCALEAILDIALHARPDPVSMSDLTVRQGVAKRYLERVMQNLVKAGILTGHRGPRGGYRLARERRRITLGQILRHLDQADESGNEKDGQKKQEPITSSSLGQQIIQPLCARLTREMMERLDKITLEDLKSQAEKNDLASPRAKNFNEADFHI